MKKSQTKKLTQDTLWGTVLEIVEHFEKQNGYALRLDVVDTLETMEGFRRDKMSGLLKQLCEEGFLKRKKEAVYEDSARKVFCFNRTKLEFRNEA